MFNATRRLKEWKWFVYMDVADELMVYLYCGRPGVVLAGGGGRGRRPDQGNGSGHSPTLPWNYSFCNEVTGFVIVTMTTLFLALRQGLESWQDATFLGRPPPHPLVHLATLTDVSCHYSTSNTCELDHTSRTVLLSICQEEQCHWNEFDT